MSTAVTDVILHCQRQLKKPLPEEKLLHYLRRLRRLHIRLQDLVDTGIGKSVNHLSRVEGPVGQLADRLVSEWKSVVERESAGSSPEQAGKKSKRRRHEPSSDEEEDEHELEQLAEEYCGEESDEDGLVIHEENNSNGAEEESTDGEEAAFVKQEVTEEEPPRVHRKIKKELDSAPTHHRKMKREQEEEQHRASTKTKPEPPEPRVKQESDQQHKHRDSQPSAKSRPSTQAGELQTRIKAEPSSSKSNHHRSDKHKTDTTSNQTPKNSTSSAKVQLRIQQGEIDSTSGVGFEAVLGCLDQVKPGRHANGKLRSPPKLPSNGKSKHKLEEPPESKKRVAHSSSSSAPSTSRLNGGAATSKKPATAHSSFKTQILQSLDPVLPPSRHTVAPTPTPDSLATMITSRKQKTKVYSGVKSGLHGSLPTLFSLCLRTIQEHIDDLGFTGGVPYEILRPVLERATVPQLLQIEHYNPYLVESTGELWAFHCKRDFRDAAREEMESWRELYGRCVEEREARFEIARRVVESKNESRPMQRKAKLAIVEGRGGAARFRRGKEEVIQNGMKTIRYREETKKNARDGAGPSSQLRVEQGVLIPAGSRAVARDHTSGPPSTKKPRKAPLMQKTLKTIKSLSRR